MCRCPVSTTASPASIGLSGTLRRNRSSGATHRHAPITGDVRHLHALTAILVNEEAGPALSELFDRYPALHPRQRRAETAVHAVPKAEGQTLRAVDVEQVGIVEETL